MSFPQRGRDGGRPKGRCRNEDRCRKYRDGRCWFVHPDQPEWETAPPFVPFDQHGPGHARDNGRGDGGFRHDRGQGNGGSWNDTRNDGGSGGGFSKQSNGERWGGAEQSQPSNAADNNSSQHMQQNDPWGAVKFTESVPATGSSNVNSGWGDTGNAAAGSANDANTESQGAWSGWGGQSPQRAWGADNNGGWGSPNNDSAWGSNTNGDGWGSNNANSSGGWGDSNDNAVKSAGPAAPKTEPSNNGLPTSGETKSGGGWSDAPRAPETDHKGKGKMPVSGGGGWSDAPQQIRGHKRRASDDWNPKSDGGWGNRRRTSNASPPTSRRPSGAHGSQANTFNENGNGWGQTTLEHDHRSQASITDDNAMTFQPEPAPAPTVQPPAPPPQPKQGYFASQLIDALVRSEDVRAAETRLVRTQRMIASDRYKHPSRATTAKLDSDLKDAQDNLAKKSGELLSRMRRLAQLPGAEKVFERIDPAIEVAWLSDGDLQKWMEVAEPAVQKYLGSVDEQAKQKLNTDGWDTRPDWVKEHPDYKNVKPLSPEQAKAIAGDDWMHRAMIQIFGTDNPKIGHAVTLAKVQADNEVHGAKIDAIEQEGARTRARVEEIKKSLQEMRERDERRAEEEASAPPKKSIAEWRRMFAANKVIYDKQTKEFETNHAAYPKVLHKFDELPPVDDIPAIAASLRPAMLESIQRLAGPRVDAITSDARKVAEEQAREQAGILHQALQPVLVLMEYAKMQERKRVEAAEMSMSSSLQEQPELEVQPQALGLGGRELPEQQPSGVEVGTHTEYAKMQERTQAEAAEMSMSPAMQEQPEQQVQPQEQSSRGKAPEGQQLTRIEVETHQTQSPSTTVEEEEVDELIDSARGSESPSTSAESESDIRL
ncbi:hypothetical protein PENSPDRAFT_747184 [Peniophora sp. CONT]|nr:hypothetical protein PENSPDRAFT_747184 [Peniophora sp. CONT]